MPSQCPKIYSWMENEFSEMVEAVDPFLGRGIYSPHSYPKLKEMPARVVKKVEENLKKMKRIAQR